jgi:hypothetical protein
MGKKDGTRGGAKKRVVGKSKLMDVDLEVIDLYCGFFHLTNRDAFADRLSRYRDEENDRRQKEGYYLLRKKKRPKKTGPSKRLIDAMYATGKAKRALVDTILKTFQEDWDAKKKKADEEHKVFEGPPRPVSLKVWPAGYPRPAGSRSGSPVEPCTREECEVALRKIIKKSRKPKTLWCSVAACFWLKGFVDRLSVRTQPAVKEIVVRTLRESYVKELVGLELLAQDFWKNLGSNLELMEAKEYPKGEIPVRRVTWEKMAAIHGVLYGDEALFFGLWQYEYGGFNTNNGPVFWLTREDRDFAQYRDLLKYGDRGWRGQAGSEG